MEGKEEKEKKKKKSTRENEERTWLDPLAGANLRSLITSKLYYTPLKKKLFT